MSLKADEWAMELPPPPEAIRLAWLYRLERLIPEMRTEVPLAAHEARFARNIIRWVMAPTGARRSLPTGYCVQAWLPQRGPPAIVLMRTR